MTISQKIRVSAATFALTALAVGTLSLASATAAEAAPSKLGADVSGSHLVTPQICQRFSCL